MYLQQFNEEELTEPIPVPTLGGKAQYFSIFGKKTI